MSGVERCRAVTSIEFLLTWLLFSGKKLLDPPTAAACSEVPDIGDKPSYPAANAFCCRLDDFWLRLSDADAASEDDAVEDDGRSILRRTFRSHEAICAVVLWMQKRTALDRCRRKIQHHSCLQLPLRMSSSSPTSRACFGRAWFSRHQKSAAEEAEWVR